MASLVGQQLFMEGAGASASTVAYWLSRSAWGGLTENAADAFSKMPRCFHCKALVQWENLLAFPKASPVPDWNIREDATCQAHVLFQSFLGNALMEIEEWGPGVFWHSVHHKPSFTQCLKPSQWPGRAAVFCHITDLQCNAQVWFQRPGDRLLHCRCCWRAVGQDGFRTQRGSWVPKAELR